MSVTKMEKVTLISDQKNQETILQAIQGIQQVEFRDLFQETTNNHWVETYFPQVKIFSEDTSKHELEQRLQSIREAVQFIGHHGHSQQKLVHLKRTELSLHELEAAYSEADFLRKLQEVLDLKKQWEKLSEQRKELMEKEEWLLKWQYLDVIPATFDSQKTVLVLGSMGTTSLEPFQTAVAQLPVYLKEIYSTTKSVYLAYITLQEAAEQVAEIASRQGLTVMNYPYEEVPSKVLTKIKEQLSEVQLAQKELANKIGSYRELICEFEWVEEVTLALIERERVKQQFVRSKQLLVLQGWIGIDAKTDLMTALAEKLPTSAVHVQFELPTVEEIQTEVPTKLTNHPLIEPFELLTEMYSLPKYEEVDPTPWFTPFYLVFFGMMVADVGYGLLLLIGSVLLQKWAVLPRGLARFVKFFEILSIPTIIWGLVYSSFFGEALPKSIFGIPLPFPILSTTEDVNTILILSVIFGLIQILVGLFVSAKENLKRKAYLNAISEGFAWQGILIGIVLAVAGAIVLKQKQFLYLGGSIAILSAFCIVIIPIFQSTSKVKGAAKGVYNLYGLTSYIGDLVSYTRLMALGISGGSIAAAFNMLVAFMPPVARFSVGLLLIVLLHALNLFLTLLSAYVHGARLQYVEFFGKFYTGGGRAFQPLKTAEKYVNINHRKRKNE
ncbi:V-type ATP synthase subunit I [Candidatus Enterococcus courvalinii]|uniref:V-type ATP synthase subunit I n=1 Tax=Candidatus Enterococcus courvalinii TaxID=2815329 RepID=A0ABS3HYP4_9ENTE|nr:V-type ATP synthase subunit I [Enterococcus sp. MSG2901]MBO0481574.1 V-type ATP synthase subunit I [Enterococcus sp. MSG2901]